MKMMLDGKELCAGMEYVRASMRGFKIKFSSVKVLESDQKSITLLIGENENKATYSIEKESNYNYVSKCIVSVNSGLTKKQAVMRLGSQTASELSHELEMGYAGYADYKRKQLDVLMDWLMDEANI